jgi:CDP-glucose 4,6-dehydratase
VDTPVTTSHRVPEPDVWLGRRVLVTGHTGFKGSWLCAWLQDLGAEVMGVSLAEPCSQPALWDKLRLENVTDVRADITTSGWQRTVADFAPSVVFHLAARSLVSQGFEDPLRTFSTNVQGTAQVLHLVSSLPCVDASLMVTTDKVYDTRQPLPFREGDFLGGKDPYSASKAAMELVVHSWPPMEAAIASARAGNVIGGGDWSDHRLLPDLVRAWSAASSLVLRHPGSVRPWQHVLEPLRAYLLYAEHLLSDPLVPRSLNFGPSDAQSTSVEDLVRFAAEHWAIRSADGSAPAWATAADSPMPETGELRIDSSLAGKALDWFNVWDWRATVRRALDWYLKDQQGAEARALVRQDLADYYQALDAGSTWNR